MNEPETPAFKDRSTGLLIFGIALIVLGACTALMLLLMLFSLTLPTGHSALQMQGLKAALAIYSFLAVAFVWLGIGSIQARRWARALLVIVSWGWLVMGVLALVSLLFFLPQIIAPAGAKSSPATTAIVMIIAVGVNTVLFVLIPGGLAAFYSRKDVRLTCERRHPIPSWTDQCPLPVLAASLWAAGWAFSLLAMIGTGMTVLPAFGYFVTGFPAIALSLALGVLWGWTAWALYRLDRRGWWVLLISLILFSVSSSITYSLNDISELYRLMGYGPAEIKEISQFKISRSFMAGGTSIWMIPALGYLIHIRRFFWKATTPR